MTISKRSAREFVGDVIARETSQMLRHTPVARVGTDPEGVHQLRVASRRLRSELRLLEPMLELRWFEAIMKELAWLGHTLGDYRDTDVLIALLEEFATADRSLDRAVVSRAIENRQSNQGRVVRTLTRPRYASLLADLARSVVRPPLRQASDGPRSVVTSQLIDAWGDLRSASSRVNDTAADLHQVRILAKRARYATEIAAPMLDDGAHAIVERLVAIQDSLGHQRDLASVRRHVTTWYDSPEAARGVDPVDARESWLSAVEAARRVSLDSWREPLAEAMVLIDDMNVHQSQRSDRHQLP